MCALRNGALLPGCEQGHFSQCDKETVFFVFISTVFSSVPVICMGGGEKTAFPSFI